MQVFSSYCYQDFIWHQKCGVYANVQFRVLNGNKSSVSSTTNVHIKNTAIHRLAHQARIHDRRQ